MDALSHDESDAREIFADICGIGPHDHRHVDRLDAHAWEVVREAFERGRYVIVPLHPKGVLRITSPVPDAQFVIDATPKMPAVSVAVAISGLGADPTPRTAFTWSAQVRFNPSGACRHGPNRIFALDANGTHVGSPIPIVFSDIMGGHLTITVTAQVAGKQLSARAGGMRILATNPTRAAIQTQIADDILQRIACHESGQIQFDAAPGATSLCPLWSGDNLGGAGIFQITSPAPTSAQVWNWTANVAAGRAKLESGRQAARNYRSQILQSHTWRAMVDELNKQRRAAHRSEIRIDIPPLSPDQVEDDAIRAFNGYGTERDAFGYPLHEFRLRMDAGRLHVNVDEAARTGMTEWQRTPVEQRGRSGDPNYVHHVRAANPRCGG